MHAVVRISRPILRGRAAGLHQPSAHLLRRANARGVGKTDVQASGSPSAAVWRLAEILLSKYHATTGGANLILPSATLHRVKLLMTVTSLPLGVSHCQRHPSYRGLTGARRICLLSLVRSKKELSAQLVFWGASDTPCDLSFVRVLGNAVYLALAPPSCQGPKSDREGTG